MKSIIAILIMVASAAIAQTPPPAPTPFTESTINFGLSQITLPGQRQTLAGMETDALLNFTEYFHVGETTLISTSPFIGGRGEYAIKALSDYLQNHTALAGANFQAGLTFSAGVVKGVASHWGERAGIFLKYAPAGSTNFNLGIDVEWNNLPGIDPANPGYGHHVVSLAVGPAFRF